MIIGLLPERDSVDLPRTSYNSGTEQELTIHCKEELFNVTMRLKAPIHLECGDAGIARGGSRRLIWSKWREYIEVKFSARNE